MQVLRFLFFPHYYCYYYIPQVMMMLISCLSPAMQYFYYSIYLVTQNHKNKFWPIKHNHALTSRLFLFKSELVIICLFVSYNTVLTPPRTQCWILTPGSIKHTHTRTCTYAPVALAHTHRISNCNIISIKTQNGCYLMHIYRYDNFFCAFSCDAKCTRGTHTPLHCQ